LWQSCWQQSYSMKATKTKTKPNRNQPGKKKKESSPMWLISELGNRLLKQSTGELGQSKVICGFYRRQRRTGWKFCVGRGRQRGGGRARGFKEGFCDDVARFIGGWGGVRSTHTNGTFTFLSEIS
jgi:hypothetical protein